GQVAVDGAGDHRQCRAAGLYAIVADAAAALSRVVAEGAGDHRQRRAAGYTVVVTVAEDAAAAADGRVAAEGAVAYGQGRVVVEDAAAAVAGELKRCISVHDGQSVDGHGVAGCDVKHAAEVVGVHRQVGG